MSCFFPKFSKEERFKDLVESVEHCDICPRLRNRRKILSAASGNLDSKVLFVGEAPGRFGADRTGVPLCGDRTGSNFEALLGNVGWLRQEVFITNAVLCNPIGENGVNGTPTRDELANCSAYLEMVISLLSPTVIVTLGSTALKALDIIMPHGIELRHGVARFVAWRSMLLFPLYHPGPRATVHRSLMKQRADFILLSKKVHPAKGLIERNRGERNVPALFRDEPSTMQQVARVMLQLAGSMTYFKMTKLMYLVDLSCLEKLGHSAASRIYTRQHDGPWPPALKKALEEMDGHEVRRFFRGRVPMVCPGPSERFEVQLDERILEVISQVLSTYGRMSNAEIKSVVYRTHPMRAVLREEAKGRKMLNKAVLYDRMIGA